MAYCETTDLLVDHKMWTDADEKTKYVTMAADAMDAKLGYVYEVPLDQNVLPAHQWGVLKMINARLASGQLIMSRASAAQESQVHAYALYLIRQAESDLAAIANGDVDLQAPRVGEDGIPTGTVEDPTYYDPMARVPSGWNPDRTSAVTMFEKNFMGGFTEGEPWVPAENIISDGGVSASR
jgi:hypothetical protein